MEPYDELPMPADFPAEELIAFGHRLFAGETSYLVPRIRYRPVDTNILLNCIAHDLMNGPSQLRWLGLVGILRLYAAPNVPLEVEEHLDEYLARKGLDPERGRKVWHTYYGPSLWITDTGLLGLNDPRVASLPSRDADDQQTAALSAILGVQALSKDQDLSDLGLATGDTWLQVVFATRHVAVGETVQIGVGAGLSVSIQSLIGAASAIKSAAENPETRPWLVGAGIVFVVVGLLLFAAWMLHEPTRLRINAAGKRTLDVLREGGTWSASAYFGAVHNWSDGTTKLQAAVATSTQPVPALYRAAQLLAESPHGMTTRDLAARIWNYERVPAARVEALEAALTREPAFVRTPDGRWQFGARPTRRLSTAFS